METRKVPRVHVANNNKLFLFVNVLQEAPLFGRRLSANKKRTGRIRTRMVCFFSEIIQVVDRARCQTIASACKASLARPGLNS